MLKPLLSRLINSTVRNLGYEIIRQKQDPIDYDAFRQQHRLIARVPAPTILDVGAFHGEVSKAYVELFPSSIVHALEPFPESFQTLVKKVAGLPQVTAHPIGLASVSAAMELNVNSSPATNSILATHEQATDVWGVGLLDTQTKITCQFSSLDAFLKSQQISHVDILKLDVQGAENKVFEGARGSFRAGLIDVIYMEIITMPTYRDQWGLAEYLSFLADHNFHLHGIYNLSHIDGRIRQMDAIFVRDGKDQLRGG